MWVEAREASTHINGGVRVKTRYAFARSLGF
jgi:hypothetical protein